MKAPFLGQAMSDIPESFSTKYKGIASPVPGDDLENPIYTGRYFIVPENGETSLQEAVNSFSQAMGMSVASSGDYSPESFKEENIADADIFLYEDLGFALVSADQEQVQMMETVLSTQPLRIEPELVMYSIPFEGSPLVEGIAATNPVAVAAGPCTWGIQATGSDISIFTGKNVKVAILDTGLDLQHPDFAGRVPAANQRSLVPGLTSVQDMHGHGTHCTGTACGRKDNVGTRYGVAGDSEIYIGKVLDNSGRGAQAWAINGINWAVSQNCKVISMSLGAKVFPGISFVTAYERAAANAVANGALIVAAAGNDSRRPGGQIFPVSSPANCPSVLAVAAIDSALDIAFFSNRSINPGQDVYIAGPGVDVYSSWLTPLRYKTISGTSMATPHVAGIAALIWEKNPSFTPAQVKTELRNLAKSLAPLLPTDVGCGLGTAP
ncbi:S8 family serine peptidase [Chitinophaga sp. S165]|uniref:S8 family serine peptidase n=1 Tax=Chitinophaga sp. S165 TaxID=2135462 RepID=UPI000D70F013|nr:S8 family serine peptidase [Chitinophaga sp. S165]PWV47019.1 subtilase family protein [Chitinophaga sp. S165]